VRGAVRGEVGRRRGEMRGGEEGRASVTIRMVYRGGRGRGQGAVGTAEAMMGVTELGEDEDEGKMTGEGEGVRGGDEVG
jgi:hypothetical protein